LLASSRGGAEGADVSAELTSIGSKSAGYGNTLLTSVGPVVVAILALALLIFIGGFLIHQSRNRD
jgi:hypothetical protein